MLDKSETTFWRVRYSLVKCISFVDLTHSFSDKLDTTTVVISTAVIYHIVYSWKCCNSSALVPSYSLTAGMSPQATQITLYRLTFTFLFVLVTEVQHRFTDQFLWLVLFLFLILESASLPSLSGEIISPTTFGHVYLSKIVAISIIACHQSPRNRNWMTKIATKMFDNSYLCRYRSITNATVPQCLKL